MYDYGYGSNDKLISSLGNTAARGIGMTVWVIIALIAALVGCFLVYFMFVKKDDKLKNPKLEWLRDFLRFDKMLIEPILKIAYIFAAIFITLAPLAFLALGFVGFLRCLMTIVFGNLGARLCYEAMMMGVMVWKNTTEINKKMK